MKAVLVLDEMPDSCLSCPCYDYENGKSCQAKDDGEYTRSALTRPSWCPLKEMPQKQTGEHWTYMNGKPWFSYYHIGDYEQGWNECLDELERSNNVYQ